MDNIKSVQLPSNGLLDVQSEISVRGLRGMELSTLFSSLDEAAVNDVISRITTPSLNGDSICDEDKAYILHIARQLTYGQIVTQQMVCPVCGKIHDYDINYDDFELKKLEQEDVEGAFGIGNYTFAKQVPTNETRAPLMRYKEKANLHPSYNYLILVATRIKTVNGKRESPHELITILENMPAQNLSKLVDWLDVKFGLDTTFKVECKSCHTPFAGGLGISADLFR